MMVRALVNTQFTLKATLYAGSAAQDPTPDAATVEVVRADGTVLLAAGTPTTDLGTGVYGRTLSAAEMSVLDTLEARWTYGTGQTVKTYTQVVGGFLCTLAELKALFPSSSDDELARIRTGAEQRLEAACGQAFVPRYALERHYGRRRVRLGWPRVRAIRSLSVGPAGYANWLPAAAIAALETRDNVICLNGYGYQPGPALVGYEHGLDYPSEDIRTAVLLAAQETADTSGSSRVIRREADGQAVTFASPSGSSGFTDPLLRSIVADNQAPLAA